MSIKMILKEKILIYVNIMLAVVFVLLVVVFRKNIFPVHTPEVKAIATGTGLKVARPVQEAQQYDISRIKGDLGQANVSGVSIDEDDEKADEIDPKVKEDIIAGLDKKIAECKEALKSNPKDKHLKRILGVSEELKNMELGRPLYQKDDMKTRIMKDDGFVNGLED